MMSLSMWSIRWRLPASYAVVALVAVISLGFILQTTLRDYYEKQELRHLHDNARVVSNALANSYESPDARLTAQLANLSFLTQTRIRLINADGQVIADSGSPSEQTMVSISAPPPRDFSFSYEPGLFQAPQASITVFNVPADQRDFVFFPQSDPEKVLAFGVASTPFGFGLNRSDVNLEARSGQKVETALFSDNALIGYVELSEGPAFGTRIVNDVEQSLVWAGALAVTLSILVGFFVSYQISTPVLQLANATKRMSKGDLSARVSLSRKDEFGLLAKSFNEMASRVEHTITTLRSFVADAAHELHTPITALHANLELAVSEPIGGQKNTYIQQALTQLKRLESLTIDLLDLSRIEAGMGKEDRQTIDMVVLLRETSELYASRADQAGLTFDFEVPDEPFFAQVNERQMRRVICNLLDNAIKFTPENGSIHVELRKNGDFLRLQVQDTGIGVPPEDLPFLFSRFHRGRNAARYPGSGLGLAITRAIVEGHQGKVSVESSPEGTMFLLQLPA